MIVIVMLMTSSNSDSNSNNNYSDIVYDKLYIIIPHDVRGR